MLKHNEEKKDARTLKTTCADVLIYVGWLIVLDKYVNEKKDKKMNEINTISADNKNDNDENKNTHDVMTDNDNNKKNTNIYNVFVCFCVWLISYCDILLNWLNIKLSNKILNNH